MAACVLLHLVGAAMSMKLAMKVSVPDVALIVTVSSSNNSRW
jgi:hypothetical protein